MSTAVMFEACMAWRIITNHTIILDMQAQLCNNLLSFEGALALIWKATFGESDEFFVVCINNLLFFPKIEIGIKLRWYFSRTRPPTGHLTVLLFYEHGTLNNKRCPLLCVPETKYCVWADLRHSSVHLMLSTGRPHLSRIPDRELGAIHAPFWSYKEKTNFKRKGLPRLHSVLLRQFEKNASQRKVA